MDNKIYKSNIKLTIPEILKKVNYYISYTCLNENQAQIYISWEQKDILLNYDSNLSELIISDTTERRIKCAEYTASSFVNLILHDICEQYGYPYRFILFYIKENTTNRMIFSNKENSKDDKKCQIISSLTNDLISLGLNNDLINTAKEKDVWDEFSKVCSYCMDANIK